jgi:predicted alpha/beta-fold hydrolase
MADDFPIFPGLTIPPLRVRAPWWSADLQTIRNYLRRRPRLSAFAEERLVLPLEDGSGDRLVGALNRPAAPVAGQPLVILIHGLSGDEASAYMCHTAAYLLTQGYPVLRLNLRGAGPSRPLSRLQYHAGRTGDLEAALAALPQDLKANGVAAVGYSLGGNMLLKFLGERGSASPIAAAVSVSAPIDLAATSRRMEERRNAFYRAYVLREIRAEAVAPISDLTAAERRAVLGVRTIREFDAVFSAPRNSFADADHYYEANGARNFLGGIAVPTLVIHAIDDPWVPAEPYLSYNWRANPALVPLLSPKGGHVGFHGHDRRAAWHDLAAGQFFGAVFSRP